MPKADKLQAGLRKPARHAFANAWQAGQLQSVIAACQFKKIMTFETTSWDGHSYPPLII
jgi:hypothetical protein